MIINPVIIMIATHHLGQIKTVTRRSVGRERQKAYIVGLAGRLYQDLSEAHLKTVEMIMVPVQ